MTVRKKVWAVCAPLLATVFLSGVTVAQEQAWPKIDKKGWEDLSEGDVSRMFYQVAPPATHPRLWLRYEFREPISGEGHSPQSMKSLTEFNCTRRVSRDLTSSSFARSNLKGEESVDYVGPEWATVPPGSVIEGALEIACANVEVLKPKTWPQVRTGLWEALDDDDLYKGFYSLSTPMDYPRAWLRHEYLEPGEWNNRAFRSAQELVEFDCKRGTARSVFGILYPENNMQGAPDMSFPRSDWAIPEPGLSEAYVLPISCLSDIPAAADKDAEQQTTASMSVLNKPFAFLEDRDWMAMVVLDDRKLFIKGSNSAAYPRVELRTEFLRPQTAGGLAVKSTWSRVEIDCAGGRQRVLEAVLYSANNLKGEKEEFRAASEWVSMEGEKSVMVTLCDLALEEDRTPVPDSPVAPAGGVAEAVRPYRG